MTLKTGKLVMLTLACSAAVYFLYFFRLDAMGLVSTDEPRYAAIGREMARSGDWITPRLWGNPWFEKPALLYWMTGLATAAGLGPDLAPRLPVAVLSVAFLAFFFAALRQEWEWQPAFYATAVLGSSAGWLAYSQIGVPDLPLAVCFNAAVLLFLRWLRSGRTALLSFAAASLGLAVLAKGLVPLVLSLPLLWFARDRLAQLLRPAVLASFAITALPWYTLCTLRNGAPFLQTFFLQHQLGRFTSTDLQHVQPVWFYLPVLLGCLFPWTALLALVFRPKLYGDQQVRCFGAVAGFGFLFFSISTNKLPGYLVPLLPSVAALIGIALHRVRFAAPWLVLPVITLAWVPVIAAMLPVALAAGIRRAWPVDQLVKFKAALLMLPLALAAALELLAERARLRYWSVAGILGLAVLSIVWIKLFTVPEIGRVASSRAMYRSSPKEVAVCAGPMPRAWHYGLNYYFEYAVPDCRTGLHAIPLTRKGFPNEE